MDRDYQSESVVYGCIKNVALANSSQHRRNNRTAMLNLPSADSWSLLNREMFALPERHCGDLHLSTEVMHLVPLIRALSMNGSTGSSSLRTCCEKCTGFQPPCILRPNCLGCTPLCLRQRAPSTGPISQRSRFAANGPERLTKRKGRKRVTIIGTVK